MKTIKKIFLFVVTTVFLAASAQAHSVWINCFESHAHKPFHAMVSMGWGHALPMDDVLNSPNGRIKIDHFELFDPAMKKTSLSLPAFERSKPSQSTANVDVFAADLGVQKIALKENSAPGVYQLGAVSVPAFYTQYMDKNGKQHLQMKPRDAINDIDKVIMAVKYQAFAKSFITLGAWTEPKPLGHGLEIIPRTNLSTLHVGDLVEVDVLFYGKPLNASAQSMDFITAASSSFGQSDNFALFSYIIEGRAQFRIQSAGQWIISVNHKEDVTQEGPLKDLYGKTDQVYHGASLTFNVN